MLSLIVFSFPNPLLSFSPFSFFPDNTSSKPQKIKIKSNKMTNTIFQRQKNRSPPSPPNHQSLLPLLTSLLPFSLSLFLFLSFSLSLFLSFSLSLFLSFSLSLFLSFSLGKRRKAFISSSFPIGEILGGIRGIGGVTT